MFALKVKKLIS